MKRYLYTFVNHQQNNLSNKLSITEFASNNDFISTKLSLFFASRGLYLCISFDIVDLLDITTFKQINKKKAINISKIIQSI